MDSARSKVFITSLVAFLLMLVQTAAAAPGALKWQTAVTGYVNSGVAIAPSGTLYGADYDGKLYSMNAATGNATALASFGWPIDGQPTVALDGTIYVGINAGFLYAVNPDGSIKWRFNTGGNISASAAIGPTGTVYVASNDSKLYALNPLDGAMLWSKDTGGVIDSSPAIGSDGTIYFSNNAHSLFAVDPVDGATKWTFDLGAVSVSSPAIDLDGTVYVGAWDNYTLFAVNSDGSLKWSYVTGGRIGRQSAVIGPDGTIYTGSRDGYLHALDRNGNLKWKYLTGGYVENTPVVAADGMIYFGSYDKKIYALNSEGEKVWSYQSTGEIRNSALLLDQSGTLFVGGFDKKFFALETNGAGLANSPWPTMQRDASRTGLMPATASADSVVFTNGANLDIYLLNLDGTGLTQLTTSGKAEDKAAITADGRKIAFRRQGDTQYYDLYLMNVDGSMQTKLTDLAQGTFGVNGFSWYPDSTRVALSAGTSANEDRIYILNTDTGALDLAFANTGRDLDPVVSPSNPNIIYFLHDVSGASTPANRSIVKIDLATPTKVQTVIHAADLLADRDLAISPDGAMLSWSRCNTINATNDTTLVNYNLYTMLADGSQLTKITNFIGANALSGVKKSAFSPYFTPDGEKIIFSSNWDDTYAGFKLYSYDRTTRVITALYNTPYAATSGTVNGLCAAPALTAPTDMAYREADEAFNFTWAYVPGATSYYLEVSEDPNFSEVEAFPVTATLSPYTITGDMALVQPIYWRVRAACQNLTSAWSPVSRVSTVQADLTTQVTQVDISTCDTVDVFASVLDNNGNPITGLTAANFPTVTDGGVARAPTVSSVRNSGTDLSVVIAMDYSDSAWDTTVNADSNLKLENQAAANFVDLMGANDRMEIIKFERLSMVAMPFTTNKSSLKSIFAADWNVDKTEVYPFLDSDATKLSDTAEITDLYDAIILGINDVAVYTGSRAVVVLTDGADDTNIYVPALAAQKVEQIVALAKAYGVQLYLVALPDPTFYYTGGPEVPASTANISASANYAILQRFADESGGRFYRASAVANAQSILEEIASNIQNQYVLSYPAVGTRDGSTRTVSVTATQNNATGTDTATYTACSSVVSTRTVVGNYTPETTINVKVKVDYDGTLSAAAVRETIPAGWAFQGIVADTAPGIVFVPAAGATDTLEFGWISVPATGFEFTYQLMVPAGEEGDKTFSGEFVYRRTGDEQSIETPDTIVEKQARTYHSSDYNPADWTVDFFELMRAVQIFNLGSYECDTLGSLTWEDGYLTPAPLGGGNRLCTPHSADYRSQNWSISLSELLRVVQFYNLANYHQDATGEDGYAPGVAPARQVAQANAGAIYSIADEGNVTHSSTDYTPGLNLTVQNQLVYGESLSAMGFEVTLPAGFSFVSAAGADVPQVLPEVGDKGTIAFIWLTPPASPVDFTYTVKADKAATGEKAITAKVLYRTTGGEQQVPATPSPLVLSSSATTAPYVSLLPASLNFGTLSVGANGVKEIVTIANNGTGTLNVQSITLTNGANFTLDLAGGANACRSTKPTLLAGQACTVGVTFTPSTVGAALASLVVASNDPDAPTEAIALSGVAVSASVADISATPASHNFGTVATGAKSAPLTVVIKNNGTADLVVSSITASGSSAVTLSAGSCKSLTPTLAAGESCSIAATFAPMLTGPYVGTLSIGSNDPDTPALKLAITGDGVTKSNTGKDGQADAPAAGGGSGGCFMQSLGLDR